MRFLGKVLLVLFIISALFWGAEVLANLQTPSIQSVNDGAQVYSSFRLSGMAYAAEYRKTTYWRRSGWKHHYWYNKDYYYYHEDWYNRHHWYDYDNYWYAKDQYWYRDPNYRYHYRDRPYRYHHGDYRPGRYHYDGGRPYHRHYR